MARRRNYKRDRRGRFARTSGGGSPSKVTASGRSDPKPRRDSSLRDHAAAAALNAAVGNKTRAGLHGAKLGTTAARRSLKRARARTTSPKALKRIKAGEDIVTQADRAINIALLTAYIGAAGGTRIATKGAQNTLNKLQQRQRAKNPGNGVKWGDL